MEYQIVFGFETVELMNKVEDLLRQGWKLAGGVAVSCDADGNLTYHQAMTK